MGCNHRQLFTSTSSPRQLISEAVIPFEEAGSRAADGRA